MWHGSHLLEAQWEYTQTNKHTKNLDNRKNTQCRNYYKAKAEFQEQEKNTPWLCLVFPGDTLHVIIPAFHSDPNNSCWARRVDYEVRADYSY